MSCCCPLLDCFDWHIDCLTTACRFFSEGEFSMEARTVRILTAGLVALLWSMSLECMLLGRATAEDRLHRHSLIRRPSLSEPPAAIMPPAGVTPQRSRSLVVPVRPSVDTGTRSAKPQEPSVNTLSTPGGSNASDVLFNP
jgi:hypothetical protein